MTEQLQLECVEFKSFSKIPRLSRDMVITEKIDGSNAQIYISESGLVRAGSRTRWISPGKQTDNFGFAGWVEANKEELMKLGPGRHFGEWWGVGIQRGYDLTERKFSLFHTHGIAELPSCVGVVPVLYQGPFDTVMISKTLEELFISGSKAAPGFMDPEGVVVFHEASGQLFKKTCQNDEKPKSLEAA